MEGTCKLCGQITTLEKSHFMPKFIGNWLKKTAVTGYFRLAPAPSKRLQDLPKKYWLCGQCEDLFSNWEREFANSLFYPVVNSGKTTLPYGTWLAKFAASISWRTLTFIRHMSTIDDHSSEYLKQVEAVQDGLSSFLLGKEDCLYTYEQHVYQLGVVESYYGVDLPANINRYMLRTVHMDIIGNNDFICTYAKLPSFIFIGVIKSKYSKNMRSSRISVNGGTIRPRHYVFPPNFFDYIMTSAKKQSDSYDAIPQEQRDKIEQYVLDNVDKARESKLFEAIKYDVDMFGNDALMK